MVEVDVPVQSQDVTSAKLDLMIGPATVAEGRRCEVITQFRVNIAPSQ